jgi:predicted MFS family arabinose efflux permease
VTALSAAERTATKPRPAPGLLLASQLIFNIGFYAVVPFLALVMTQDFGMSATAVGVVLGARVFSQQGLFLVGGMITDRFGPRRAMLVGCLVRISGYLTLAMQAAFRCSSWARCSLGWAAPCSRQRWSPWWGRRKNDAGAPAGRHRHFWRSWPSAGRSGRSQGLWPAPCSWVCPSVGQRWPALLSSP